ncbi:kinase-like domain-containing protein [Peziza echinospora]|nr:kinase-like domain-containing protein [Peziza echinospora]
MPLEDFYTKEKVNRVIENTYRQLMHWQQNKADLQPTTSSTKHTETEFPFPRSNYNYKHGFFSKQQEEASPWAGLQSASSLYPPPLPPPIDPTTILNINHICIDWSDLEILKVLHDTCLKVRIRETASSHIPEFLRRQKYVFKCPTRKRGVRSLTKELALLCTMPSHKNIAGRPSFIVTANLQRVGYTTTSGSGSSPPSGFPSLFSSRSYSKSVHSFLSSPTPTSETFEETEIILGFMTPYIPSGTLTQNLQQRLHRLPSSSPRRIPPEVQLSWSLQLIDAAIHLHRVVGISHNGVKPDNILIDDPGYRSPVGGRLWLIDFEQLGTYRYLRAPERWGGKVSRKRVLGTGRRPGRGRGSGSGGLGGDVGDVEEEVDGESADVFSIATIIWLIHENIFTFHNLGTRNLGRPLEFSDTPAHLRKVLCRCLDEAPGKRPSLEELRRAVGDTGRYEWHGDYRKRKRKSGRGK